MATANGFLSAPWTDSSARRTSTHASVPGSASRHLPSSRSNIPSRKCPDPHAARHDPPREAGRDGPREHPEDTTDTRHPPEAGRRDAEGRQSSSGTASAPFRPCIPVNNGLAAAVPVSRAAASSDRPSARRARTTSWTTAASFHA